METRNKKVKMKMSQPPDARNNKRQKRKFWNRLSTCF